MSRPTESPNTTVSWEELRRKCIRLLHTQVAFNSMLMGFLTGYLYAHTGKTGLFVILLVGMAVQLTLFAMIRWVLHAVPGRL